MRRGRLLKIAVTLSFMIIVVCGLLFYYHPTHLKFNDRFVIGNNANEIAEKYGEFDKVFYKELLKSEKDNQDRNNRTISSAGYIVKEKQKTFLGTSWEKYYWITFDDKGIAAKVEIKDGGWGG